MTLITTFDLGCVDKIEVSGEERKTFGSER
jgi:hypothetical protein